MIGQGAATQLALSSAVDRLTAHASEWSTERILDEGLDLVRDRVWADASVLYALRGDRVEIVCRRPGTAGAAGAADEAQPADWFPWGLAPVSPRRFLFVEQAAPLPAVAGDPMTLGEHGISSCLHLPILERQQPIGALQLFWVEPRLVWDDGQGRILRSLGRFLLRCAASS